MTGQCAGGMASLDRQMKTKMGHKDFVVEDRSDGKGLGVYTRKSYVSGDLIAVLHGEVIAEPHLHSLQITPDRHLYDPDFTGCLLHSCNPNALSCPKNWKYGRSRP